MVTLNRYLCACVLFFASVVACFGERGTAFTVVAYNIENFFDVDGISIFDDYQQDYPENSLGYSPLKLRTKLAAAVEVLKSLGDGTGPEVILFQEFENDFSPDSAVTDFNQFLDQYRELTVEEMLGSGWKSEYSGIPSVAWMYKAMADAGLTGYEVAVAPQKPVSEGIAHVNATFSKFPITEVHAHATEQARDILEVAIDVSGSELWVYNNHWKSGASNPEREPIRAENARVLRQLIDARLDADPSADIIIGGDLNAHYNQSAIFPQLRTGVNDVLGSSGDEGFGGTDLYNLWYEIPVEERFSEVWRGRKGTLMHLIVSPGLYDDEGVSYIDSSFDKLVLPGVNVDAFGRPLEWHFAGSHGGGASDHFPVFARFTSGSFLQDAELSTGDDTPHEELRLGISIRGRGKLPDGRVLNGLSDAELAPHMHRFYSVRAKLLSTGPLTLKVGDEEWAAFAPDRLVYQELLEESEEGSARLIVRPDFWRGSRQLIVEAVESH